MPGVSAGFAGVKTEVIDFEVARAMAALSQLRPGLVYDPLAWADAEFMELVFVINMAARFGWDWVRQLPPDLLEEFLAAAWRSFEAYAP